MRTEVGTISQTDIGFTGQRDLPMLSIMDYIARFYDPAIGRFVQPDTIVPAPANPQSWNRYAYVLNNPVRHSDPSEHKACQYQDENGQCVGEGTEGTSPSPQQPPSPLPPQDGGNDVVDNKQSRNAGVVQAEGTTVCYGNKNVSGYCDTNGVVDFLNCGVMATQDIATSIDLVGAGVEFALVATGCFVEELPGCGAGLVASWTIFNLSGMNTAETVFIGISLALTTAADRLDDGSLGEASSTSFTTFLAGGAMWDPIADLFIDAYASGYNHGIFNGIDTIMNGGIVLRLKACGNTYYGNNRACYSFSIFNSLWNWHLQGPRSGEMV